MGTLDFLAGVPAHQRSEAFGAMMDDMGLVDPDAGEFSGDGFSLSKGFQEGVGGWGGLMMSLGDVFSQMAIGAAQPSFDGGAGGLARGFAQGSARFGASLERNKNLRDDAGLRKYIEEQLSDPNLPDEERKLLETYNRGGRDLSALQLRMEAIQERRAYHEARASGAAFANTPAARARDRQTIAAREQLIRNPTMIGQLMNQNTEANAYRFARRPLQSMEDPEFERFFQWSAQSNWDEERFVPWDNYALPGSGGNAGPIVDGETGGEVGEAEPDGGFPAFADALGFGPDQRGFVDRVTGSTAEERARGGPQPTGPAYGDFSGMEDVGSGLMDLFGMGGAAGAGPGRDRPVGRDTVAREEALRAYRPGPLQRLQEAPQQVMNALAGVPEGLGQAGSAASSTLAAYSSPQAIAARAERGESQISAGQVGLNAGANLRRSLGPALETLRGVPEDLAETWDQTLTKLGF